ncbi:MAG: hypothetical protein ACRYFK_19910 [Janthinobacterium lividum]
MPLFVVSLTLPESFDAAVMAVIPRHRAFINKLLAEHVIESYAISADRSRGWVTMNGTDEATVRAVVAQFPLYRFLREVVVDELFIYDSAAHRFPSISPN